MKAYQIINKTLILSILKILRSMSQYVQKMGQYSAEFDCFDMRLFEAV